MTIIPLNQGNPKLSEVGLDTAQPVLSTPIQQDAMSAFQAALGVASDAIRRAAYIFNSNGQIEWDGSQIIMSDGITAHNMIMTLLQNEPGFPTTINLVMQGTTGSPDTTHFQNIVLNNNEMIYLELDRAVLAASGGTVVIENAIDGGSGVTGKTLRKVTLSSGTGMPAILNPPGGASQTVYMPVACRLNGTNDVWWIPHGIRWPAGSLSSLGAVFPSPVPDYPDFFVESQPELTNALSLLTATGGVICVNAGFTINSSINVPDNIVLLGKDLLTPLTFTSSGQLNISGRRTRLQDLYMVTTQNIAMVAVTGDYMVMTKCRISLPPAGSAIGVRLRANACDIRNCEFNGVMSPSTSTGISFDLGYSENTEEYNVFTE